VRAYFGFLAAEIATVWAPAIICLHPLAPRAGGTANHTSNSTASLKAAVSPSEASSPAARADPLEHGSSGLAYRSRVYWILAASMALAGVPGIVVINHAGVFVSERRRLDVSARRAIPYDCDA